ncbi:MAG: AAA family ATPase [Burkholderiales bacterium]|nr:AAA family ATPase [Burkholderiales bacterium]
MSEQGLRDYVIRSKFSQGQKFLLDDAMCFKNDIEVHGAYTSHIPFLLSTRQLQPIDRQERSPRRKKTYNKYRPIVIKTKDPDGNNKLCIFVAPSREYVDQFSEIVLAYCAYSEKKKSFDLKRIRNNQIRVFHYPNLYQSIGSWSGLDSALSLILIKGDIVILGHIDEFSEVAHEKGFRTENTIPIQNADSKDFGQIALLRHAATKRRLLTLAITHSYWGSASGLIAKALADAGCSDIIYISKCGTLIDKELVHQLVSPISFHLWYPGRNEVNWQNLRTPIPTHSEMHDRFADIVYKYKTGTHLTVPTVMGETEFQSEDYRPLHPATIDNEDGYIAKSLSLYNEKASAGNECHFTAFHFVTDYLITKTYRESERSNFDLASVEGNERLKVQQKQHLAIKSASEIVCKYTNKRTLNREPLGIFTGKFRRPPVSPKIIGRARELGEILNRVAAKEGCTESTAGALVLYGPSGMGKTKLAAAAFSHLSKSGFFCIWVDLRSANSTHKEGFAVELLNNLLRHLGMVDTSDTSWYQASFSDKLSALLERCDNEKILFVFDNLECLIEQSSIGRLDSSYSTFRELIETVAQSQKSFALLTSKEKPSEWSPSLVCPCKLKGMTVSDFRSFIATFRVKATQQDIDKVRQFISGNPKAAELIVVLNVFSDYRYGESHLNEEILHSYSTDLAALYDSVIESLSKEELDLLVRITAYDASLVPIRREAIYQLHDQNGVKTLSHLERKCLVEEGEGYNEINLTPVLQTKLRKLLDKDVNTKKDALTRAFHFYKALPVKKADEWSDVSHIGSLLGAAKTAFEARLIGDAIEIWCSSNIRRALVKWGEHALIRQLYTPIVSIGPPDTRKIGRKIPNFKAIAFNMLGIAELRMGRPEKSIALFNRGLARSRGKSGQYWRSVILSNLINSHINYGNIEKALRIAKDAVKACELDLAISPSARKNIILRSLAYAHGNLGSCYFRMNRLSEAKLHLEEDLKLSNQAGDNNEGIATANALLGLVELKQGKPVTGRTLLARGLSGIYGFGNTSLEKEVLSLAVKNLDCWSAKEATMLRRRYSTLLHSSYQFEVAKTVEISVESASDREEQDATNFEEFESFLYQLCNDNTSCKSEIERNIARNIAKHRD